MQKRNLFSWAFTLLMLGLLGWASLNLQAISDWYVRSNYQPPAKVAEFTDTTTMTDEARAIFYATAPELNKAPEFNQNCKFPEHARVLGCYVSNTPLTNGIFVLDIDEPSLEAIEPVTAAHEMLHAAYDRLSGSEKRRIDALIRERYEQIKDPELEKTISQYRDSDPGSVPTELHSILGTEIADLGPELEEYYGQYFQDRQAVVRAYRSYTKVFDDIQAEVDRLKIDINRLKTEIKSLETEISIKKSNLNNLNSRLKALREANDIEAYNALVPTQNAAVASYNSTVRLYNSKVAEHNLKVKQVNQKVLRQNQLVNAIDSKFESAPAR